MGPRNAAGTWQERDRNGPAVSGVPVLEVTHRNTVLVLHPGLHHNHGFIILCGGNGDQ